MHKVTKRFEFCYSHCLPSHPGQCSRLHGHNSVLEVTFACANADLDEQSMVIDFSDIKILVDPLIEMLDHHDLNEVLNSLYLQPTSENLCRFFRDNILATMSTAAWMKDKKCKLHKIRVTETPNNWAEWETD